MAGARQWIAPKGYGIFRTWPTWIRRGSVMPLRAASTATLVLKRAAMLLRVSPDRTR